MILPPLTCPAQTGRGFSYDSYDVAYNHRDVARTSPQRETARGGPNARCRRAARLHRDNVARPWVHSVEMLADLVHGGLATAHRQTMRVGRRKIQFARVMITDAGRKALEG
jgi:hypothetical protein